MSLKKQLVIIFGALAFIVFVVVGVSFWTFVQWQTSSTELQVHYQRNLLLEQIRVEMYRAFKEVPDAVTGDDPNSKEEFEAYLKPAESDFKQWSELPNNSEELAELKAVRVAVDSLVKAAYHAFELVELGRKEEAFQFMESNLEDKNFAYFQQVTEEVAVSGRKKSLQVKESIQKAQRNAQIVLVTAALGVVALILLLSAYISSDLFKPLRDIESGLESAVNGDLTIRLDKERKDEVGKIYTAFNHLLDALARKEKLAGGGMPGIMPGTNEESDRFSVSSKLVLHSLSTSLLEKIEYLKINDTVLNESKVKNDLVNELTKLSQAVEQVVAFGFPLELKLVRTDISRLLYDMLLYFKDELVKRSVSLEFDIAPAVGYAMVDKLKLSAAVNVLIKNAMLNLPETGGKIGIRARVEKEDSRLLIEVADNGISKEVSEKEILPEDADYSEIGINLAKTIIEQHGGQLKETNAPDRGNYFRIELPLIIST